MGPILLAYLYESEPLGRAPLPHERAEVANMDHHLRLRRKLFPPGLDMARLKAPRKRLVPDPTLRNGSPEKVGMHPDTAQRLRHLCQEWADVSGEPHVTLVARDGVILLHRNFTPEGQEPIAVDHPMAIASITKAWAGMLLGQFVDQGLVQLDDPIGKYLPDFPVTGNGVITLRHCMTHTSGFTGHYSFGGVHNPWLDNVLLQELDLIEPGNTLLYNGMGYDLAAKVMEQISGKSAIRLMQENLLEPLGAIHTRTDDFACCSEASAEDLARLGQLILNGGAYGQYEFFAPETFAELLPRPLRPYYPNVDAEWGIGLTWMRMDDPENPGQTLLSPNTIGHGAASSAILRVDLDQKLVVAQSRQAAGRQFGVFLAKFLRLIDECVVRND
ncbi:MAG: serine hydrolase [Verrucomicrobia bacterium]|nr:serine hydrolase [Verrucomicrobiota bacterium]